MTFTLEMASVPDRARVVLEIWHAKNQVAEIHDPGTGLLRLEIYANPAGSRWSFDLDEWLATLTDARERLSAGRGTKEAEVVVLERDDTADGGRQAADDCEATHDGHSLIPDIWVLIMTTGGVDRDLAVFDSELKAREELPDAEMAPSVTFRVERATGAFESCSLNGTRTANALSVAGRHAQRRSARSMNMCLPTRG
jgi:hypothetical protein